MHNSVDNLNIFITRHAARRLAQRGVCREAFALLTLHGIDVPVGGGRVRREVRHQQVSGLHADDYSLEVIDRALRLEAIYASDDTLITCYQRAPHLPSRRGAKGSRMLRRSQHNRGGGK